MATDNILLDKFRFSLNEKILPNAPKNWRETQVKYARNTKYFGMIRALTVPQEFVKDAAKILRNEFYQNGVLGRVRSVIEQSDPATQTFRTIYRGIVDFSEFRDSNNSVSVNTTEDDISVKISAFENTQYEFPVDDDWLTFDSQPIRLKESATFLVPPTFDIQRKGYTGIDLIANEVLALNTSSKSVQYRESGSPNFAFDADWFFNAQTNTTVTFKLKSLKGTFTKIGDSAPSFAIGVIKSDGTTAFNLINQTAAPGPNVFNLGEAEYTTTILAGQSLYLYQFYAGATDVNSFEYEEGEFYIEYETESVSTPIKGIQAYKLYDKLIQKMNGIDTGGVYVPYPTSTGLLSNLIWRRLVITCGDAIRGFDTAKIKTSFTDFYKSINAVCNAGFGMENGTAILEEKAYFFRYGTALDLGDKITNFGLSVYKESLYSSIKAGYPDQTYDALNGRDEVNSQQNYATDMTASTKELDLTSTYRADPYGIEYIRVIKKDKDTTDDKGDNDNFFVYLKEDLSAPDVTENITGVQAGNTYYNWFITPKRNLLRHGNYLKAIFDNMNGYTIRFSTGLKNVDVTIEGVTENSDIDISALPTALFRPYLFTFDTGLVFDALKLVEATPFGRIRFMYRGLYYNGFIAFVDGISIDVAENSRRSFTLLCGPDVNLLGLVRK